MKDQSLVEYILDQITVDEDGLRLLKFHREQVVEALEGKIIDWSTVYIGQSGNAAAGRADITAERVVVALCERHAKVLATITE